jgi:cytochrome c oxidase subunit 1
MLMRWQLGFPGRPVPGGGVLPESMAAGGVVLPEFYNALVTMHGTFMVFFAIMPLLVGVFGNYLIPLKIGAPDMAFPRLNMASFWTAVPAGLLMLAGFLVVGGPAAAGWTSYAPLSANSEWTGVGLGQVFWCLSLVVLGLASIMGAVNYITTIIQMRAPGMHWFRLPLSIWSLFVTSWLVLLAIPVLSGAAIMLLFDQTIGTHFFEVGKGGQPLLWQHLFWFFGHPEVYILILPAMGMVSDIIANGSRKPIFGYTSMVLAIIAIGFLGWGVWGHHMFMSGMNPTLGTTFMVSTLLISVPSAIKTFNWLGTLWEGNIQFHVPLLHSLAFVSMFVIGGLSGVFMAAAPVDVYIHDTYFIVAHLHYVLFGGSLFAIFGAVTYWYPKMFGRLMNPTLGRIHFWLTFVFYNLVFFPMHQLGLQGHMRRLYDPNQYEYLKHLQPLNTFISISAFLLFATQLIFLVNFIMSWFRGERAGNNPWHDNGLEWTVPSPPPHGNFATVPHVYRGPYEYSSPLVDEDYLPQDRVVTRVPPREPGTVPGTREPLPPDPAN